MFLSRSLLILLAAAAALPIAAQDHGSDRTCLTDAGTSTYVSGMHRANAPRSPRALATSPTAGVEMRNGMFVVQKSPANSLLDHPNDLEGKSVVLTPTGIDRYRATTVPLQYDTNVGTALHTFVNNGASDWPYIRVTLTTVKLPLFGQSVDTIYLTAFNSIALSPPGFTPATQYDRMEAIFVKEPTIAPLLMTNRRPATLLLPTVYERESADGIVVTWRAGGALSYDVQAKIAKSGEITFSYRTLGEVTWGAVLITPGVGAFLPGLTTVAQLDDPADDVAAEAPASARAALDIRSVTLQQATEVGGCLLTIGTGATPATMMPPLGDGIIVKITFGDAPPLTMTLLWNSEVIVTQSGRAMRDTATAGISGNQIQIAFTLDSLRPISTTTTHMVIETSLQSMTSAADRLVADVPLTDGNVPGVELSSANGAEVRMPIIDAFTWPIIDLQSVWESVRGAGSFTDAQIDGVAIFQNFHNDMTISNAAYATIGNPQDEGVSMFATHTPAFPRVPNLMNLNDVNYGNLAPLDEGRIVLHEFGHRWLQFVETMENGTATMTLNPQPAHPPQFASAPAAFPVVNAYDTSTMGGGYFAQNGNSFTSSPWSPYGYSWLDLYLMGLAAAEEVPVTYVIDNSNPPLGKAYNPPGNVTVTGTRHDVAIQQVIDAMGPRRPSTASSPRVFNVVFVMVAAPGHDVDVDLARVDSARRVFAANFVKATGNRASVNTLFFPPSPRRHAVQP